jgi:hypothetical protein
MPAIPAFTLTTVFFFAAVLFLTGLIGTAVLGAFESWLEGQRHPA